MAFSTALAAEETPSQPSNKRDTVTLSNGFQLPSIALDVDDFNGKSFLGDFIEKGLDQGYRLIETSHKSGNEKAVADAVAGWDDVQVTIKIWYTHLGYARTEYAVKESLRTLGSVKNVHVLIQWPRCYSALDFADCEGEEKALPDAVRKLGPASVDEENGRYGWETSWQALEDLYEKEERIASIGVANFDLDDVERLMQISRVKPHVYQGRVMVFLRDEKLRAAVVDNKCVFQVAKVMEDVVDNLVNQPIASQHVAAMAADLSTKSAAAATTKTTTSRPGRMRKNDKTPTVVRPAQVLLAFFLQNGHPTAVVVNRVTEGNLMDAAHLPFLNEHQFNDALTVSRDVSENQDVRVREVEDTDIKLHIHNKLSQDVTIYWVDHETDERISLGSRMTSNSENSVKSFQGHVFEAVDSDGRTFQYEVRGDNQKEVFVIGDDEL